MASNQSTPVEDDAESLETMQFRTRLRRFVALPISLCCALVASGLGVWSEHGAVDNPLVTWMALFALVCAGVAPLWADEVRPGDYVGTSAIWLLVAGAGTAFLSWRAPDLTAGAVITMASVVPPAGFLLAWLYRARSKKTVGTRAPNS